MKIEKKILASLLVVRGPTPTDIASSRDDTANRLKNQNYKAVVKLWKRAIFFVLYFFILFFPVAAKPLNFSPLNIKLPPLFLIHGYMRFAIVVSMLLRLSRI